MPVVDALAGKLLLSLDMSPSISQPGREDCAGWMPVKTCLNVTQGCQLSYGMPLIQTMIATGL